MAIAPQDISSRELSKEERVLLSEVEEYIDQALARGYSGSGAIHIDFTDDGSVNLGHALLYNARVRRELEKRYLSAGWVQVLFFTVFPGLEKAILHGTCLRIKLSDRAEVAKTQTPPASE